MGVCHNEYTVLVKEFEGNEKAFENVSVDE
jgi:hypothetical protein